MDYLIMGIVIVFSVILYGIGAGIAKFLAVKTGNELSSKYELLWPIVLVYLCLAYLYYLPSKIIDFMIKYLESKKIIKDREKRLKESK